MLILISYVILGKQKNNNLYIQLASWSMDANRMAQKGYLFPIHNDILNSNRLISQNPYWMGKY
jgi:poly(3-hydroxyalkanoate) synthetase